MYKHILLPTDGSPGSDVAIRQGIELAAQLGAAVSFLYVVESPTWVYLTPETISYLPQLQDDLRRAGNEARDRAAAVAKDACVADTTHPVGDKSPVDAISEAEKEFDLVVMATHGRSGFNRWMFGSVAEGALRRATVPYLLIRLTEEEAGPGPENPGE